MSDNIKYYYLDTNKKPIGPLTKSDFEKLHLPKGTKIWYTGLKQWIDYVPQEKQVAKSSLLKIGPYILGTIVLIVIVWFIASLSSNSNMKRQIIEGAYDCEEFQMYLDKFYRDIEFFEINKRKPRTIIMKLAPMQYFEDTKDYHGVSYGYKNDNIIEIYINEDSWKKFSRPQKYLIMYHELAHDILNIDDLPDREENYGKLMCPVFSNLNKISMDDFIEMSHETFESYR
jgi:hypothetical protein